jgi:hypothetical protein
MKVGKGLPVNGFQKYFLSWERCSITFSCEIHVVILVSHLTPRPESASELYRLSERRLSAKLVPTFADRGCHVVSVTDPYGRIIVFLDWNRYFLLQVAPQLYSRG